MCFLTHGVDSAGIDPAIVEIKQSTHRDGIVDSLIAIADGMQSLDIRRLDGDRLPVDLAYKMKESFFRR